MTETEEKTIPKGEIEVLDVDMHLDHINKAWLKVKPHLAKIEEQFYISMSLTCITILPYSNDVQALARKLHGVLKKAGFSTTIKKRTDYRGDEVMEVLANIGDDVELKITDYMPKTCKLVTETIEIKEVKEHTVKAQPARTETRTRIVCED